MSEFMVTILYAEDSLDDVFLMQYAFKQAGMSGALQVVPDGRQAIRYLEGDAAFADRSRFPLPDLLMLDVRMPGLSGFDVLRHVRASPAHRQLPVIMFTSSRHDDDLVAAEELGANGYVVKPPHLPELVAFVNRIRTAGPAGIAAGEFARAPWTLTSRLA